MIVICRMRRQEDACIMIQRIWRGWKVRDDALPPLLDTIEYHYGSHMQLRGMLHFHGMPTATVDRLAYMSKYINKN